MAEPININDFLLGVTPAPQDTAPFGTPGRAKINLRAVAGTNPDEVAKNAQKADQLGVTPQIVEAAPEQADAQIFDNAADVFFGSSPATSRFYSEPAQAAIASDAMEDLSFAERVIRGFERGVLIIETGQAGLALRRAENTGVVSPAVELRARELQDRLRQLGEDTEGFTSAVAGVAEFFGQRVRSLDDPRSAAMTATGAVAGAAAGAVGGPLAPITSTAGSIGGGISGLVAAQLLISGETQAAMSYLEQRAEGVDPNVAYYTSLGVGILGGALEAVGGMSFFRPISEAGKRAFREGLQGVTRNPKFRKAMAEFAVNYGGNVAVETGTEVAQEAIAMTAEQLGRTLTEGIEAEWKPAEWTARLAKVAEKAAKTSALLAAPGSGFVLVQDIRKARRAEKDALVLDEYKQHVEGLAVTKRSPEAVAEHARQSFAQAGIEQVYIPVGELDAAARQLEDPAQLYADLGVTAQLEDARWFGGDVRVATDAFTQYVTLNEQRYGLLRDNVKFSADGLTAKQGQEVLDTQSLDEAAENLAKRTPAEREAAQQASREQLSLDLADEQLGMRELFSEGREAGMTEAQYASYLASYAALREDRTRRQQRRDIRREQRRVSDEAQARRAELQQEVEQSVSQEPLYQATLSLEGQRLDRGRVLEIFGGDQATVKQLPRVRGRRIVAQQREPGLDPDVVAELYGFESGDVMLFQMLDQPTFEQAVEAQTEQRFAAEYPGILQTQQQLAEELESVSTETGFGNILNFELGVLRSATNQGRLSRPHVIARAQSILAKMPISQINVRQLEANQRAAANDAYRALRAGDIYGAADAKAQQALAFEMTRQAYQVRPEIKRGNKYMRKFMSPRRKAGAIPIDYFTSIQDILAFYNFGPRLTDRKRKDLTDWVARQFSEEGITVQLPPRLAEDGQQRNYQDLTYGEWRDLLISVRQIEHQGLQENRLRREGETQTRQEIADTIAAQVLAHVPPAYTDPEMLVEAPQEVGWFAQRMARAKEIKDRTGHDLSSVFLDADSLVRAIDNFRDLGPAYTYIKGGIDRAITEGYQPGQVGYVRHMKAKSEELVGVFNLLPTEQRAGIDRQQRIPGVRRPLTRSQQIVTMLNMGNRENIQALLDGNEFTQSELDAIVANSTPEQVQFVQATWNFLDTFWPEIVETTKRRENRIPERVQPIPLETPHGTLTGGYYFLRYDERKQRRRNPLAETLDPSIVEEEKRKVLQGSYVASHTNNDHTKTRTDNQGHPVTLDLYAINSHMEHVIYDLEVGDAVADAYRVLHHRTVHGAFNDQGRADMWRALDLWLGDVTAGEVHRTHWIESLFRRVRTGTTIAALGLNVSVAALQPLGLIQAAVQIGKGYMFSALWDVATLPAQNRGDPSSWLTLTNEITAESGMMETRQGAYSKDIVDASRGLRQSMLGRATSRATGGRYQDIVADTAFIFVTKMQWFTDIVTWTAAKKRGLQDFKGDPEQSTLYADRMVTRTQGSSHFHERTGFERGTIHPGLRQTELVRVFSLFLNFFAKKLNVAYERTKTAPKTPVGIMYLAIDMLLLFSLEGLLSHLITQGVPDDIEEALEEGEYVEAAAGLASLTAWQTVRTVVAGAPVAREFPAAIEGFSTGGAMGSFAGKLARAAEQVGQGEADVAAATAVNSVLGVVFRYPAVQMNRGIRAEAQRQEEEDIGLFDYLLGPPRQ